MPLSPKELIQLRRSGAKFAQGETPASPSVPTTDELLVELVRQQGKVVDALRNQKQPVVNVEAPEVNVAAPHVTVRPPAASAPCKWVFKHTYNNRGDLVETHAAIED